MMRSLFIVLLLGLATVEASASSSFGPSARLLKLQPDAFGAQEPLPFAEPPPLTMPIDHFDPTNFDTFKLK